MISEKRGQPPEYDPPRVIEVRDAVREDAPAACEVIRRSISELCEADHRNDPEILRRWLANKIVGSWIIKPGNSVLVAVDNDNILAVGSVTDAGEITLNYVSPDARFTANIRPHFFRQLDDASDMGKADVVIDDIDPSIKIRTCLVHSTDFVVAGHVGEDCIGRAVFIADDFDGLVRCFLVDIGTTHLRAFAGE